MNNLLLVTVDSLRADHCGFIDSPFDVTETLDRLAKESVVYERAIAPGPRTPSSMPVVFTGEFFRQQDQGVYRSWDEKSSRALERQAKIRRHLSRFRTLPEQLRELGYSTGVVTSNPWTTKNTGFDRGFDEFRAIQEETDPTRVGRSMERLLGVDWTEWLSTWTDYFDTVQEVRDRLSEPYFLWIFILDPHQPYLTPREYRQENTALGMYYSNFRYNYSYSYTDDLPEHLDARVRRAYRDTVRSVDGFVEQVHGEFADDDPVLVVHSDHGEAFQEHGTLGHRPQLYRENLHVPLLIHNTDAEQRVNQLLPLRQLPEILTAIGDPDRRFKPEAATAETVVSRTEESEQMRVRTGELAYLLRASGWEYVHGSDGEELYRLSEDPSERENLIDSEPEEADNLRTVLRHHEGHRTEQKRIAEAVEVLRHRDSECIAARSGR